MRILHTSDWHLGRCFGAHRLLDDQAQVVDWLVALVVEEAIDLVVVAGDLYDRAVPPAEAVELLGEALGRLRSAGAEVAAIAGNHDSAERVAAYDGLTDAAGVVIRGGYRRASQVVLRHYADGPLALVTVPYLDPQLAPPDPAGEARPGRPTHEAVLALALARARAAVPAGTRSLVLSHAFVTGARPSTSERELAVGTAGMVSVETFGGFSYVALGHLHQAQVVAGSPAVRYSGSPLAYSFSETGAKVVTLVELGADGRSSVSEVPVPVGRPVRTVRAPFAQLASGPVDHALTGAWLRVELTDAAPVVDAHRALRARFPHLVEIERVGGGPGRAAELTPAEVRRSSPDELVRSFWADVTGEEPSELVAQLLGEALRPPGDPADEAAA